MKRFSRIAILLVILGAFFALVMTPALATEETEEAPTTTTGAEEPAPTSNIEPAVPVTTLSETETVPDWTYRYMIPTAIVVAVLVVVVTTVQYFTSVVRKRYRIVKE